MVDHVKTLLLNMSWSDVSGVDGMAWSVDPSFVPVRVPGCARAMEAALFSGVTSVSGKVERVESVYPVAYKPETAFAMSVFDQRVSVPVYAPELAMASVFSFYKSERPGSLSASGIILSGPSVGNVFTIPDAMPSRLSSALSALAEIDRSSPESVMRLAARILAYAVQLENMRLLSVGRVTT